MRRVLVTGGAGYVGSQSVLHFQEQGWHVVTVDDLSRGHAEFGGLADQFEQLDIRDEAGLEKLVRQGGFDGIVHCAARSLVGESVLNPLIYYRDNLGGAVSLVNAAVKAGGVPVVFSSSSSVYGEPESVPIREDAPCRPINPYGFSKWATERLLRDADRAYGLRSVSLRYFNAAGADPAGRVGERHEPETHLLPNIIAAGLRQDGVPVQIYGDDYATRDGTCLRDYVHTVDLARAHQAALEDLWEGGETAVVNVGSGTGATVRELIAATEAVLARPIPAEVSARRPGDPAVLLSSIETAEERLSWRPVCSGLEDILSSAVAWHQKERSR